MQYPRTKETYIIISAAIASLLITEHSHYNCNILNQLIIPYTILSNTNEIKNTKGIQNLSK